MLYELNIPTLPRLPGFSHSPATTEAEATKTPPSVPNVPSTVELILPLRSRQLCINMRLFVYFMVVRVTKGERPRFRICYRIKLGKMYKGFDPNKPQLPNLQHTYIHLIVQYMYTYIYVCVCVCVSTCVYVEYGTACYLGRAASGFR
jgi:hypothetical protein